MLSKEQIGAKLTDVREQHARKQIELREVGAAAITDATLIPTRNRLRVEVRDLEDEIGDLAGAQELADAEATRRSQATNREMLKDALAKVSAIIGEQCDLGNELDESIAHQRALFTRLATLEAAWKGAVAKVLTGPRRVQIGKDLLYISVHTDSQLAARLRELGPHTYGPHLRSRAGLAISQVARMLNDQPQPEEAVCSIDS